MERVWIDSFDISFKSPFRNLKSAILLGAMLFALRFQPRRSSRRKSLG